MKEKILRMPRPMGLTAMMSEWHKNPVPQVKESIENYLISQWMMSSGYLMGRTMDANQLSIFLGCSPQKINLCMRDSVLNSKIWDKDKQEDIMNALIGQSMMWAMEDRMDASHQVDVLRRAQGEKYMPFISGELNKALGIKQNAANNMQGLFKALAGGGSINIFNNIQQNQVENNTVSLQDALSIIQEENKKLEASKEIQYIEAQYDMEALPEVVASKQQGVDTSKEALTLNSNELAQITDDYKGAIESSEEAHHVIRRELELMIDRDAEDPELEVYPG